LLQVAPVAVSQLSQLTLLSRTAALAILEAALKQMNVCALLHKNNVNHLSHSPACFFAGRTSLSCLLPSCCLLLACWWCRLRLLAGAYQYWRTVALAFSLSK
jgi:hypothetical protein